MGRPAINVLVVDVGGSHVKMSVSGVAEIRRFRSGKDLTPALCAARVLEEVADWKFDVVSLGFPGRVTAHGPAAEPGNLAIGWVGFDYEAAFRRPIRIANDAVMQALGGYTGGRMLFLGLGTGLGSALVTEHVVVPLELGVLPWRPPLTIAECIGRQGFREFGESQWQYDVAQVIEVLGNGFHADYVLLGGGNAKLVEPLPQRTRRGGNADAFKGGFRLWEETVEPHDRRPSRVWRVVR